MSSNSCSANGSPSGMWVALVLVRLVGLLFCWARFGPLPWTRMEPSGKASSSKSSQVAADLAAVGKAVPSLSTLLRTS
eukprot:4621677-Amphidinium_carterae.1